MRKNKNQVMKKTVLFLLGSMFMVSCGEKEMTPEQLELQKVTEQIEFYQAKADSSYAVMMHVEDSIVKFYESKGLSNYDAWDLAQGDFGRGQCEVGYEFYKGVVADKKAEQQRLAVVITAMK